MINHAKTLSNQIAADEFPSDEAAHDVKAVVENDSAAVSPTVRVVLPAFNEEEALTLFLDEIVETLSAAGVQHEVIVVDDGSSDSTAQVVQAASERLPVRLVPHEVNQGLAAALRTGLLAGVAASEAGDVVVTMDADRTQRPEIILLMLEKIRQGCDLVIASRYRPGAVVVGVPWHRNLLSFGGRVLFQTLFPTKGVRDYTSGARAYSVRLLDRMIEKFGEDLVSEEGFSCMADVLLKARSMKSQFGEVPIDLRYDYKPGLSKMSVASNVWKTLRMAARVRTKGVSSLKRTS